MNIDSLKMTQLNFLTELQDASTGKKNSLPFIIHKLSLTPLVKEGETFEVLVIGGSILKKSLIKKIKQGIKILKIENEKNVYFHTEKGFLNLIFNELYPDTKALALNFAYPLKPVFENGKLDGILIAAKKEANFHSLVGKKVGLEIENYVFNKSKRKIKVSVANDTVCLMLSGLTKFNWNNLAAGIVGTGLNFAFFTDKHHLVNLESASFDKFTQTFEGKGVDQQSDKPGKALFEKETSGAYLYKHFNIAIKERKINYPNVSSTEELDIVSHKNIPQVSEIAQNILRKSAQLVACQIAGVVAFKKRGMVFNMEGSLFWKGNNYRETVEETVRQLVSEYKVDFVEIENSAIVGAARSIS